MKITDPRLRSILTGPCASKDGRIYCLDAGTAATVNEEMDDGINVVKRFLKRYERLYEFLRAFFSPGLSVTPHLTPQRAVARAFPGGDLADKIMVNIGAGVKPIHPELINLDVYPYRNIQIVAEGSKLPFRDGSVDLVICESVIEHVTEPEKVFAEIRRVLAPGGYAYVSIPFMYPFHASPNDFTRFTRNALRQRFAGFEIREEGMRAGPMTAIQGLLMHLFAIILSFGSYRLYMALSQVFMVVFSPLKLLDLLFCVFPYSHEIAADIYVFVRKNE